MKKFSLARAELVCTTFVNAEARENEEEWKVTQKQLDSFLY